MRDKFQLADSCLVHMKFPVIVQFTTRHQRNHSVEVPFQPDSPHDSVCHIPHVFYMGDVKFTLSHTHFLHTHTRA